MGSLKELTDNLDDKVRKLVSQKQDLSMELDELKSQIQLMQTKNSELEEKVAQLEERNKILRIAGSSSEGDNREIKLKINEIVREVDKCIAQLNQ